MNLSVHSKNEGRLDFRVIYEVIEPGSKVLDLGCGTGELLSRLVKEKAVKAQGVELNDDAIHACVEKGLSVFHSDIDSGLPYYPEKSFDYVILNQSLQEVKHVSYVIQEALRVGRKVIVGFPNFAHWSVRMSLFFRGRTPITPTLPNFWHTTPNIRFLSIKDFKEFCSQKNVAIADVYYLGAKNRIRLWPNFFAENAVFVLTT